MVIGWDLHIPNRIVSDLAVQIGDNQIKSIPNLQV